MNRLMIFLIFGAFAAIEARVEHRLKTGRRIIPADVLRDFPDMCFASTLCKAFEVGSSWELKPFCGRSTCVTGLESNKLMELAEDCNKQPRSNSKCKLDTDKTDKTASFPGCCPVYSCEDGAELEFEDEL